MEFQGKNYLYAEYGSTNNLPVVYIGGAFQTIDSIRPISQGLEAHGHTIVLDLPGFGEADLLEAEYGFDFYCELLREFCRAKGFDSIGLIGASYGSAIAYSFAANMPDLVTSLTLAGTMKSIPEYQRPQIIKSLSQLREGDLAGFSETAVSVLMNGDRAGDIIRYNQIRRMLKRSMRRLSHQDQLKYLLNTERLLMMSIDLSVSPISKTVVFTGEFDAFTTPDYCAEVAASIPNSEMVVVRNADHMFHVEQLQTTNALFAAPHYDLDLDTIPCVRHYAAKTEKYTKRFLEVVS